MSSVSLIYTIMGEMIFFFYFKDGANYATVTTTNSITRVDNLE